MVPSYCHHFTIFLACCFVVTQTALGATLKISANSTVRAASESEANYTTTHLQIDEVAGDAVPITVFFDPGAMGVETAEVWTNLNRRDRAEQDANGDGIEDAIVPPNGNLIPAGNDDHYFKAYTMTPVSGGYLITLYANKTGAYRLTARFRFNGQAANTYNWYNDSDGGGKRDHCIVVGPVDSRNIRLYEINVFNVEATGDTFFTRSTLEDLHNAPGAAHNGNNRWDLDYLTNLGCNWLWFQPVHPNGIEGRENNPNTGLPYDPGSPYAVKNFFEINEMMTVHYNGSAPLATNRAEAMTAFQNFVAAADAKGVGVMLDAPFNHTAYDCEVDEVGIEVLGAAGVNTAGWSPYDKIKDREARFYSRNDGALAYSGGASSASNVAVAPDRNDFGKWNDVIDVFFGRYSTLVTGYPDADTSRAIVANTADQITLSDLLGGAGSNGAVTRAVWRYFARYVPYWLEKTGVPAGSSMLVQTSVGVDGLRADFGQGMPPQFWEYVINVARTRKWNFVFMTESLDGGNVTYRSSRHFEVLNENIVFPLKTAGSVGAYRSVFEDRRNAYGQALVLLNNTSHDEANYTDPWNALIRYAVCGTVDGAPMIFPGQELGLADGVSPAPNFGYQHYEFNFGKFIPHFKRWNSMQPAWADTDFGNDQLYPVYAGINAARAASPALRSSNRYFLNRPNNTVPDPIFGVAKFVERNASPAVSDVVFAFANIDRNADPAPSAVFAINQDTDANGISDYGIKPSRFYNVKNIAAYIAQQSYRRDIWQWRTDYSTPFSAPAPKSGSDLFTNGLFVGMNKVPTSAGAWTTAPYEAQYLKLFDVTAPTAAPAQPAGPHAYPYEVGESVTFTWPTVAPDAEGVVPSYRVSVVINGGTTHFFTSGTSYTVSAQPGDTVSIHVRAVNPSDTTQQGPASVSSAAITMLDAGGDEDGDGAKNGSERVAGTNPFDIASRFQVIQTSSPATGQVSITWTSVPGKSYQVESAPQAIGPWTPIGPVHTASAGQFTKSYTDPAVTGDRKFFRVLVVP